MYLNTFLKDKESKKIMYSVHSRMSHRFKNLKYSAIFATAYAHISFSRQKRTSSNNKKIDQATKEHRK